MSSLYVDGFFYHPDGALPAHVSTRVADGTINPRLDDLFAVAIQETRDALSASAKRRDRLFARLDAIEAEIALIDDEEKEIEARLGYQHEVIAKYQRGDDLDEAERELLTPKNIQPIRPDKKKEKAELDEHQKTIPEGWEVANRRVDDEFVYFTIKRERTAKIASIATVTKRVAKALDQFFAPDFNRKSRVQVWDRLGTLSPIFPGAG